MTVTSPPGTGRRSRVAGWLGIGILLVAVGTVGALIAAGGQWGQKEPLDPTSAAPDGTRALVQILQQQGVSVTVTSSRADAIATLAAAPATLVLPDAPALSDAALGDLAAAGQDVVLIDPRSRSLRLLADDARAVGVADDALVAPACVLGAADRSGDIRPRTVFAASGVESCYPAAGGWGLLVAARDGGGRVAAVDGAALFTNDALAEDGNAALALNLLGSHPQVVWYLPTLADSDLSPSDPTLGELTPPWVSPVIVLLIVAAVGAALWRGIRFGPLVAERMPVSVRGEETSIGRAYLYERADDLPHVAGLLRRATTVRVARLLALAGTSSPEEVAVAVSAATGIPGDRVRDILHGPDPSSRRDLAALAEKLHDLEVAVREALRPERTRE